MKSSMAPMLIVVLGIIVVGITIGITNGSVSLFHSSGVLYNLTSIVSYPDKLGWMDDAILTDTDRARIAILSGSGQANDLAVIKSIQAGSKANITRRDFELLRQDRRRAKAAYPSVSDDDLYTDTWLQVDADAKIPESFCTSGNSNGTEVDGKWYLDGGCYISVVKSDYPLRLDAAATKQALTQLNTTDQQKLADRITKWGYSYSSWEQGGNQQQSLVIDCNPTPLPSDADDRAVPGKCVIIVDYTTQYLFDFNPREWIHPAFSFDSIKQLASFATAVKSVYRKPTPTPFVRSDGMLVKGETCPEGRLCFSHWNGDGYDNTDIGPANPVCWSLSGFGFNYAPCNAKDERRSTPESIWTLAVAFYGFPEQSSTGWTERECKDLMPNYITGFTLGMQGQDQTILNRGNLRQARCFQQGTVQDSGMLLIPRTLPVIPDKSSSAESCVQGDTLMPGQSCTMGEGEDRVSGTTSHSDDAVCIGNDACGVPQRNVSPKDNQFIEHMGK